MFQHVAQCKKWIEKEPPDSASSSLYCLAVVSISLGVQSLGYMKSKGNLNKNL